MARHLAVLLISAAALLLVAQIDAAPSEAEEFWRTFLTDSPLPDAILTLLHPETNSINKAAKHSSPRLSGDANTGRLSPDIFVRYGPPQRQPSTLPPGDDGTQQVPQDIFVSYGPPQRQPPSPVPSGDDDGAQQLPQDIFVSYGPPQRQSSSSGDDSVGRLSNDIFVKYGPPRMQPSSPSASSDDSTKQLPPEIFVKYGPPQVQPSPRSSSDEFLSYGPPQSQTTPKASGEEATGPLSGDTFVTYGPPQLQSARKPSNDGDNPHVFHDTFVKYGPPQRQSSSPSHQNTGGGSLLKPLFFHEEAVQVGKSMAFHFPPASRALLGMLPRRVAASIPFSTSSPPSALAQLGIAANSAQASSMLNTLRLCELPPVADEARFCAASLESLVERAMAALGSRDIRPVASELPFSGAPFQPYTIRHVRPVEGSSFVSCHDLDYPYAVYLCHGTGPARAYVVDIEGARGDMVTVAAVCHTDTTLWDPEHISFRILRTKPGGRPVCHVLPYGNIMWAKNVALASSA